MTANNDALAMTDADRAEFDKAVADARNMWKLFGGSVGTNDRLLIRASEHIEALNVRNLNFGNAYRELEARVTAVAAAAWNQGYDAGYQDENKGVDTYNGDRRAALNPYTQTHSTEEN
jgi:hypothetical protein